MMRLITKFNKDESGAVTVDWVVLTAAIILLGFSIMTVIQTGSVDGVDNMFAKVNNELP